MGLFDYVEVQGPSFVCEHGHPLEGYEFQTKDLGCTMGRATIPSVGEAVVHEDGGWNQAENLANVTLSIYGQCEACPAWVQAKTANLIETSVDFDVEVLDGIVMKVTRTGQASEAELRKLEYFADMAGPYSFKEAQRLHLEGLRNFFGGKR